ncbi:MAG: ECF transporter S component [Clostridia bacterium]|nr:ECF transporter S component [Clostridia bacterium]
MASGRTVDVRSIVYSAACLALCVVLPFLTGGSAALGTKFSPMHFPVLLCGFIAGPLWGGVVGGLAPFVRFLVAGAPAIYPMGIRMAAELCVYGIAAGLFYRYLPKKPFGIYVSLICAQLFGRLAWGAVQFFLSVFDKSNSFYFEMIVAQTVTPALPGIVLQLILIPPIVIAMQRARFISKY